MSSGMVEEPPRGNSAPHWGSMEWQVSVDSIFFVVPLVLLWWSSDVWMLIFFFLSKENKYKFPELQLRKQNINSQTNQHPLVKPPVVNMQAGLPAPVIGCTVVMDTSTKSAQPQRTACTASKQTTTRGQQGGFVCVCKTTFITRAKAASCVQMIESSSSLSSKRNLVSERQWCLQHLALQAGWILLDPTQDRRPGRWTDSRRRDLSAGSVTLTCRGRRFLPILNVCKLD